MEIIGRLTADAVIRRTKAGKEVVNFSIAINDHYKTRDGENKQVTTYVECSYWVSTKVANVLTKGSIVSLFGRIGTNAYIDQAGKPAARLTFHVNNIKVVAFNTTGRTATAVAAKDETTDDLPF